MLCCVGYQHTDGSKTDYTEFLSFQFAARKSFLCFLGIFGNITVFFIFLYPVNATQNISGCQKHACNNQFLYTIRIGSWCVKHYDSLFCAAIQRNIIHTCSCSRNHLQVLAKFQFVKCCTSYQNSIRILSITDWYKIFTEIRQSAFCNCIKTIIFVHYRFASSNFFINVTSDSTPSYGIAL